jgi:PilZ domain
MDRLATRTGATETGATATSIAEPGAAETSAAQDDRRALRFPMLSAMKICWGAPDFATAPIAVWGLNISEGGAAFVSDEPLPLAVKVHLELPTSRVSAVGVVRNCMRWGSSWRVGVEFSGAFAVVG